MGELFGNGVESRTCEPTFDIMADETEISKEAFDKSQDENGKEKPRSSSKGRRCDGIDSSRDISIPNLSDGLVRYGETGDHKEEGDHGTTLKEKTKKWKDVISRSNSFGT